MIIRIRKNMSVIFIISDLRVIQPDVAVRIFCVALHTNTCLYCLNFEVLIIIPRLLPIRFVLGSLTLLVSF